MKTTLLLPLALLLEGINVVAWKAAVLVMRIPRQLPRLERLVHGLVDVTCIENWHHLAAAKGEWCYSCCDWADRYATPGLIDECVAADETDMCLSYLAGQCPHCDPSLHGRIHEARTKMDATRKRSRRLLLGS